MVWIVDCGLLVSEERIDFVRTKEKDDVSLKFEQFSKYIGTSILLPLRRPQNPEAIDKSLLPFSTPHAEWDTGSRSKKPSGCCLRISRTKAREGKARKRQGPMQDTEQRTVPELTNIKQDEVNNNNIAMETQLELIRNSSI